MDNDELKFETCKKDNVNHWEIEQLGPDYQQKKDRQNKHLEEGRKRQNLFCFGEHCIQNIKCKQQKNGSQQCQYTLDMILSKKEKDDKICTSFSVIIDHGLVKL